MEKKWKIALSDKNLLNPNSGSHLTCRGDELNPSAGSVAQEVKGPFHDLLIRIGVETLAFESGEFSKFVGIQHSVKLFTLHKPHFQHHLPHGLFFGQRLLGHHRRRIITYVRR
jgi:hypothetical protein